MRFSVREATQEEMSREYPLKPWVVIVDGIVADSMDTKEEAEREVKRQERMGMIYDDLHQRVSIAIEQTREICKNGGLSQQDTNSLIADVMQDLGW